MPLSSKRLGSRVSQSHTTAASDSTHILASTARDIVPCLYPSEMDFISIGAFAFSLAELAKRIWTSRFVYPAWEIITLRHLRHNYGSLNQKFGTLQALVLITIFPDAKQIVDRVEKHVLGAKTQDAIELRKSTSDDCTMLAVAAAIMTQVAITALALEDIDKVHWTANAAFVLSLIAGGLSVFYACLVQQRMSSLFTTDEVKDFFSQPSSSEELRHLERDLDRWISKFRKEYSNDGATIGHRKMKTLESMIKHFKSKNRWKSASFHSILMVKAPTLLLKYALASFLIGLGVYFGCLAFSDVGSQKPQASYRTTFIVYIAASFLGLLVYYVPATLKELELSPARRYAQIMTNELPRTPNQEEREIIQNISTILNSEEPETYEEHQSDDALSWEERLEDMDRPQQNPV